MDPFVVAVVSPAQDFNVLVDILPVVHSGCLCDSLRPSSSSYNSNLAPKPWGSECTLKNCFHSHCKSSNSNTSNSRLKHGRVRWITEDIQSDKRNSDHSHTRHYSISRLTFAGSSTSMIRFDFNHQASPYLAINDYRLSHTYPNMQPPSIRRENRRKAASASPSVDRCCSHPNHSTAQTLATAVRKIPSLTLPRTILINPDYPESTRRRTKLGSSTSSSSSTTNIELEKRKKQLSSSSLAAPKPPLKSVMDTNISFKLCWLEQPSFLVQPTKSLDIVRRASENGIIELKKQRQKHISSSSNKSKNGEEGNGVGVRQSPKSASNVIHTDTQTSFTQQYMLKPPRGSDIETNTCSSDSIHSIITINSPWGTNC